MRGLLRAGMVAVLIAGVAAGGWMLRDEIGATVARLAGGEAAAPAAPGAERAGAEGASPSVVGPEAAAHAEAKILALGRGERMEAVFSGIELTSLARHGLREFFPDYVSDVSAGLEADRLVLGGKITVREVPGIERLGASAFLLGDTAAVSARGRERGPGDGRYGRRDRPAERHRVRAAGLRHRHRGARRPADRPPVAGPRRPLTSPGQVGGASGIG